VSLAVALVGGLYLVLLLISLIGDVGIPGRAVVVGVRLRRDQAGGADQVRRVALGHLLLAGAGCQGPATEKITREQGRAALVYFAARAYAPRTGPTRRGGCVGAGKGRVPTQAPRSRGEERYVSDPDGKLRDAGGLAPPECGDRQAQASEARADGGRT
jgi:hypothetical protein